MYQKTVIGRVCRFESHLRHVTLFFYTTLLHAKTGLLQFQFQGCSRVVTRMKLLPCDKAILPLLQPSTTACYMVVIFIWEDTTVEPLLKDTPQQRTSMI